MISYILFKIKADYNLNSKKNFIINKLKNKGKKKYNCKKNRNKKNQSSNNQNKRDLMKNRKNKIKIQIP